MQIVKIKKAGLDAYQVPKRNNRWHLPVCSALKKEALSRLSPNHPGNWEEVDFDGCPTMCYVLTGKSIKLMNSVKSFTSFFSIFAECIGIGPAKEFFPDLWLKAHNLKARARNEWEYHHHRLTPSNSHLSMSVRTAAKLSIY